MARLRAVFLLLYVTLGLLTGCGSSGGNGGGGTTPPPPSTGSLTITVAELPSGASASITVSGPSGYTASVTSTQTLQVAPGSYTVAASSVSAGNSNYYPAIASQSATVAVSTTASVTVDYATIIPKTTKVLDAAGLSSLTVSSDGSTITLSTSSNVATSLQPNDVLASGIAPAAPNGLLVKIQSVASDGTTVKASVTPAALTDAIQQGSVQISGVLGPDNTTTLPTPSSSSRPAQRFRRMRLRPSAYHGMSLTKGVCEGVSNTIPIPLELSLISPKDPSISFTALSGEMDLCASYSFGIAIKDFHFQPGTDIITLGFHTGVNALDEGQFSITKEFPGVQTAPIPIEIGIVPATLQVIVSPYVTFKVGQVPTGEEVANNLGYDATLSLGVSYDGSTVSPVLSATSVPGASATIGIDGSVDLKVAGGIKAGFKVDNSGTIYVKSDGYSEFKSYADSTPCWNLTWGIEGQVGAEISLPLGIPAAIQTEEAQLLGPLPIAQSNGTCFAPVLSTISPTTAVAGSGQLTLAVTGSNFVPASTVNWNGQALATTYVDTNDLTAVIPASDLATGGTFPVTVNSPDNPGGTSAPMNFTVSQVTVTVSPASVAVPTGATQQFTATVAGTSNTAVNWSVNGITGGNAGVGTISASGLYSAPAAIPNPAIVAVSAASQAAPNAIGTASVSVNDGKYTYTSFKLPGSYPQYITGISDSGDIVGSYLSSSTGCGTGFIYSGGTFSTVAYPGSRCTFPAGISHTGQIVGFYGQTGSEYGFVDSGGSFTSFDLPSTVSNYISGINDSGQIIGEYGGQNNVCATGFVYSGGKFDTVAYPGGLCTSPGGINNEGQIVGTYYDMTTDVGYGFVDSGGNFALLNLPSTFEVSVTGINDFGQIVGQYGIQTSSCTTGFVYSGGKLSTITYPGSSCTFPVAINNSGQVAGTYADTTTGAAYGFVATPVNY
jgi:hypothetical protein